MYVVTGLKKAGMFGLLHDAHEAYLGDVVEYVKKDLLLYDEMAEIIQYVINRKYVGKYPKDFLRLLENKDISIRIDEMEQLLYYDDAYKDYSKLGIKIFCYSNEEAEREFLNKFEFFFM